MHRLSVAALPVAATVERTAVAGRAAQTRGRVYGENASGARAVFDVVQGYVARVDADGTERDRLTLVGAQDPMNAGLVAVDESGDIALVMACRSGFGDAQLVKVDLKMRNTEIVRSVDGPGWLTGGFTSKNRVIVCEQKLGERPRFSVIVQGKVVWSADGLQQPSVPVAVSDDVIALVVCLKPDALTGTGPSALCVLDVVGGAIQPLAPAEGASVRVERDAASAAASGNATAIVVDGDRERVRVTLASAPK